jgi:hypothetical protein
MGITTSSNTAQFRSADSLPNTPVNFFHLRAACTAGMGFSADGEDPGKQSAMGAGQPSGPGPKTGALPGKSLPKG